MSCRNAEGVNVFIRFAGVRHLSDGQELRLHPELAAVVDIIERMLNRFAFAGWPRQLSRMAR
jgi:hypothetical protein